MGYNDIDLDEIIGKTVVSYSENDGLYFTFDDGKVLGMYHSQDCCENVSIEDIIGSLDDLVGNPLLMAEVVTSDKMPDSQIPKTPSNRYEDDSSLWTSYKFATIKGYVTIRWFGTSNGYYSVDVDCRWV